MDVVEPPIRQGDEVQIQGDEVQILYLCDSIAAAALCDHWCEIQMAREQLLAAGPQQPNNVATGVF
jgi:hypothetical protein